MENNSNSYFIVYRYMVSDLKLGGSELLLYALIFSFTNEAPSKCFYGSQKFIAQTLGITRQTANACLKSLIEKGLIERRNIKTDSANYTAYVSKNLTSNVKKLDTPLSNNLTLSCQKILHNNKNNINNDKNNYKRKYNQLSGKPSFDIEKIAHEAIFNDDYDI